ncbi:ADP-ribosylation factor-like protein 3 [Drosophila pseudoobscura]|uniref:ADP-ribosylation factor-like protein 3 n=1 Tax=Drosophila pseudoobscura pseudoobscura TaxID=46245 RepID=A0A6I8UYP7_DROPS|nr:ADP-ribosylation factor-like protein 3 [Drosophila pseudoobscura]
MGVLCAKLRRYFCSSCCCFRALPPPEEFQVLLLGPAGSGKTELGHRVSGRERGGDDLDPTNGVRCYRLESAALQREDIAVDLQLTEVGGNAEMQRLWKHYYAASHALIYCFDLGSGMEELEDTFALLRKCLQGTALDGKPVLLVAKRHRDGVQLYDVEHSFGLDQLARTCGCPLHICHMDDARDLGHGIVWLCRQLVARRPMLEQRVRYDVNMQVWHRRKKSLLSRSKMAQVHRGRFRRPNRKLWPTVNSVNHTTVRPSTAPPTIFLVRSRQEAAPNPEQAAS